MTTNQRDYTWIGFTPRLRTSIDMQIHADIQMYMNKKEKRFCARTCHIIPFAAVRRAAVGCWQLCVNSTFFSYSEAIYNPLLLTFFLSLCILLAWVQHLLHMCRVARLLSICLAFFWIYAPSFFSPCPFCAYLYYGDHAIKGAPVYRLKSALMHACLSHTRVSKQTCSRVKMV